MAGVTLRNLTKTFKNVVAVDNMNLEIRDKEFLVLVGPSGCGKTTALRMVAGLEEVTIGRDLHRRALVNDVSPKDRDIAMVFQNYALYPHMSVYDNMAFGLKLRKVPRAEIKNAGRRGGGDARAPGLLERKPKQLSGGQRQRVALGRAIVREPQGLPDGRAALEPGRQAARADPRRADQAAPPPAVPRRSTSPTTRSRR